LTCSYLLNFVPHIVSKHQTSQTLRCNLCACEQHAYCVFNAYLHILKVTHRAVRLAALLQKSVCSALVCAGVQPPFFKGLGYSIAFIHVGVNV